MNRRSIIVVAAAVVIAGFAIGLLVMVRRSLTPPTPARSRDAAIAAAIKPVSPDSGSPALDAPPAVLRDERERLMTSLRESGRADEVWAAQAGALFDAIGRSPGQAAVAGCFVAGCGATFTFPSEAEFHRRYDELESLEAFRAWTGGKRFTSPETLADGRVVFGLVLYRPD